ncbi:MAG: transposase [Micromonosporaceae bacterium]
MRVLAPSLLALPGVAELTAAKIVAETAGIDRFKSKDAYARHNGTAPLPVWSGNRVRHRLARTGNRQLNCAIHRIAAPRNAAPPKPAPTSNGAQPPEIPPPRRCAPSSAAFPASSTARCSPTPRRSRTSARQLDIGASRGR